MAERRNLLLAILTRAALSIVVLGIGIAVLMALVVSRPEAPPERTDLPKPAVRVFRTKMVPVQRQAVGFGTARAKRTAAIPAEVTAIVEWVSPELEAGNRVQKDAPLVRLDDTDFQHQLETAVQRMTELDALLTQLDVESEAAQNRIAIAEREFEIAQRDLARVETLVDEGAARQPELDRAMLALQAAERMLNNAREEFNKIPLRRLALESQQAAAAAQQKMAQMNVDRSTIRAPFDGVIVSRDVALGEQVNSGRQVARLVDLSIIELPLRLPASARPRIQREDHVTLQPAGDRSRQWTGRIQRIAPIDETSSRTFEVYIEVMQDDEAENPLTPGLYLEGRITSSSESMAMVVPRRALSDDRLLTVEDGRLQRRTVTVQFYINRRYPQLGVNGEDYWAVLEDPLPVGTLVALSSGVDIPIGVEVEVEIVESDQPAPIAQDGPERRR